LTNDGLPITNNGQLFLLLATDNVELGTASFRWAVDRWRTTLFWAAFSLSWQAESGSFRRTANCSTMDQPHFALSDRNLGPATLPALVRHQSLSFISLFY